MLQQTKSLSSPHQAGTSSLLAVIINASRSGDPARVMRLVDSCIKWASSICMAMIYSEKIASNILEIFSLQNIRAFTGCENFIRIYLQHFLVMSEKFSLKWNDFQTNVANSFRKLRNEDDFYDVTLVSDDRQQVSAHKIVLSASSEYFRAVLKSNNHSHPIVCLNGVNKLDLKNIIEY